LRRFFVSRYSPKGGHFAMSQPALHLRALPGDYAVCRLASAAELDWGGLVTFVGKTDGELSLVCESARVPASALLRAAGCKISA
jgi:hypothetical protein